MLVIRLKDLVVEARHGVNDWEKERSQKFVFNLELTLDDERAVTSDDLADTADYGGLKRIVLDVAQNNSFNLLERLAGEIADRILRDKRVKKLIISVDKPDVYENGTPGIMLEVNQTG